MKTKLLIFVIVLIPLLANSTELENELINTDTSFIKYAEWEEVENIISKGEAKEVYEEDPGYIKLVKRNGKFVYVSAENREQLEAAIFLAPNQKEIIWNITYLD